MKTLLMTSLVAVAATCWIAVASVGDALRHPPAATLAAR
jgi:hypothetical protein